MRKLVKLAKCPICKKIFIKHGNQVYDDVACQKNQELIRKYGKFYYKQLCKEFGRDMFYTSAHLQ